jgi:hypothetical protein
MEPTLFNILILVYITQPESLKNLWKRMKLVRVTITSRNIQEWVWNVKTDCFIAKRCRSQGNFYVFMFKRHKLVFH